MKKNKLLKIILCVLVAILLILLCVLAFLKLSGYSLSGSNKNSETTSETSGTTSSSDSQAQASTQQEENHSYDRQERIDAYQAANPSLSYEECVKRVYMNLDCDPYTNTVEVSDLDSYVMLVNKYSGLPSTYVPSDLTYVDGGGQVRAKVAEAFGDLEEACSEFGLSVTAWSAYRSYEYQDNLYSNGVTNYGLDYAEKYWTHPGFSEHQTGLTIDVCLDGDQSDLDAARYNAHYSEFLETLHTCGFILRYADDKQEYTLIAPESWHIRYVGVDLATYLYNNNLSLDEFYGMIDAGQITWDDVTSNSNTNG